MLAEVPSILTDIGTLCGVIVAVLAAVAALWRFGPLRWLAHRLIRDPFSELLDAKFEPLTIETRKLRSDLTAHMGEEERQLESETKEREHRQALLDERLDTIAGDVAEIKDGLSDGLRTVHGRIDLVLGGGNVEIRRG